MFQLAWPFEPGSILEREAQLGCVPGCGFFQTQFAGAVESVINTGSQQISLPSAWSQREKPLGGALCPPHYVLLPSGCAEALLGHSQDRRCHHCSGWQREKSLGILWPHYVLLPSGCAEALLGARRNLLRLQ